MLEIVVQASGMCLGVAIMMLIALYEDDFGSIFVSSATATVLLLHEYTCREISSLFWHKKTRIGLIMLAQAALG